MLYLIQGYFWFTVEIPTFLRSFIYEDPVRVLKGKTFCSASNPRCFQVPNLFRFLLETTFLHACCTVFTHIQALSTRLYSRTVNKTVCLSKIGHFFSQEVDLEGYQEPVWSTGMIHSIFYVRSYKRPSWRGPEKDTRLFLLCLSSVLSLQASTLVNLTFPLRRDLESR